MLRDLVLKNRSVRRFYQDHAIDMETLRELVDLARLCPSGGNVQPLRYILSADPEKNASVFPNLTWARYIEDWPGPKEGEQPSAYIIVLCETELAKSLNVDPGIVGQTMLLGAVEKGLNGCMHSSVKRAGLRKALEIPKQYEIMLVIALGKGKEEVVIEPVGPDGDITYYRDCNEVHHVPKLALEDLIIG